MGKSCILTQKKLMMLLPLPVRVLARSTAVMLNADVETISERKWRHLKLMWPVGSEEGEKHGNTRNPISL